MKKNKLKQKPSKMKKGIKLKIDARTSIDLKSSLNSVQTGINEEGIFIFAKKLNLVDFAKKLSKSPQEIIKYFFLKGQIITLNSLLAEEQMGEFCLECGYDFKWEEEINEDNFLDKISFQFENLEFEKRTPVVTIMGHVDHGKTTLLDYIKNSKVVELEKGGITQHIGAYTVDEGENMITLIDTPGHEAFTQMRKRGASVTDIVVIVVSADDGVMPQTQEAIDHAKAAKTPIIVFINKMDKPEANPEKVIGQLSEINIVAEEWGGDTIFVKGSAKNGQGVEELKKAIILLASIMDLKTANNAFATGTTIESYMDKGLGPIANILIQNGTLKVGDFLIVGNYYGKIRKIINDNGVEIKQAKASMPILISGLNGTPEAGDKFLVTKDEKNAKNIINNRQKNNSEIKSIVENNDGKKVLNIIIKSDVNGSIQAIKAVLEKIKVEGAILNIVRCATGQITESDILLAKVASSIIYGFNSIPSTQSINFAKSHDVTIKFHNVIYNLKDEIEAIMVGILDPVFEEKIIGHAQIRQIWEHSAIGKIAGSIILDGEISRKGYARVIRKDVVILEKGKINSLKQEKNPVNKVLAGKECGITIENFKNLEVDDIIEIFLLERMEIKKK